MHVEIIVQVGLYEVIHKASDGRTDVIAACPVLILDLSIPHVSGSEFCLGLVGKDRLLDLYAYGSDYTLAYVLGVKVLL